MVPHHLCSRYSNPNAKVSQKVPSRGGSPGAGEDSCLLMGFSGSVDILQQVILMSQLHFVIFNDISKLVLPGIPWLVLLGTSITVNKCQPSSHIPYFCKSSCTTLPAHMDGVSGRLPHSAMTQVALSVFTEYQILPIPPRPFRIRN